MASKRNTRVFTPIFIFSLILCALSIPLCYMVWVQIANLSTGPDFGSVAYSDSIYQMLPKFAPLNAQVLAELPPPPGVELTNLNNLTDKNPPLVLNVNAEGLYSFADNVTKTLEQVHTELLAKAAGNPQLVLAINADEKAPWGKIVKIRDIAAEAKIKSLVAFTKDAAK